LKIKRQIKDSKEQRKRGQGKGRGQRGGGRKGQSFGETAWVVPCVSREIFALRL